MRFLASYLLLLASIIGVSAQTINVLPSMMPAGGTFEDNVNITCTFPEGCTGGKYWFNGAEVSASYYTQPLKIEKDCRLSIAGVNNQGQIITDVITKEFKINKVTAPFITTTPEENSIRESFYVTTIQWNNATTASLDVSAFKEGGSRRNERVVWLVEESTGNVLHEADYNSLWSNGKNSYKAYIYKNYRPTKDGLYTLHITKDVFVIDGKYYDKEIVLAYRVGSEKMDKPIFTPEEGTYEEGVNVSITYPEEAFYKFYTINGGDITLYNNNPINITKTSTIEAWGMDVDYVVETQHATATYTIVQNTSDITTLPAPVIARNGNIITITEDDKDAIIKFWFDDNMNTAKLYDGPFTLTKNGKLSAVAYRTNALSPTVDLNITHFEEEPSDFNSIILRTPKDWMTVHITSLSPNSRFVSGYTETEGNPFGFVWDLTSGKGEFISNSYYNTANSVSNDGTVYGMRVDTDPLTGEMRTDNNAIVSGYYANGEWTSNPKGMTIHGITGDNKLYGSLNGKAAIYDIATGETTEYAGDKGEILCANSDGSIFAGYITVDGKKTAVYWTNSAAPTTISTERECYVTAMSGDGNWMLLDNKEWGEYSAISGYRHNVKSGQTETIESMGAQYPSRYEWMTSIANDGTLFGVYDRSLISHEAGVGLAYTTDGIWTSVADLLFKRGVTLNDLNVLSCKYVSADQNTFILTVFPKGLYVTDGYNHAVAVRFNTQIKHDAPTSVKAQQMYGVQNVKVTWEAPLYDFANVASYKVLRNGETIATTTERLYYDIAVEKDQTYAYSVVAVYKDGAESEPSFESEVTISILHHTAARNLTIRQSGINDVNLSWMSPFIILPKLQYFHEDKEFAAFGTGKYNSEFGIRITDGDLKNYEGLDISTFQFLPTGPQTAYQIRLYEGTPGTKEYEATPFYTQNIDPATLNYGTVNTVIIDTPQSLNTSRDLIIGLYIESADNDNMLGVSHDGFKSGYTDLCRIEGVHDTFIAISEESSVTTEIVNPLGVGLANGESILGALVDKYEVSDNGNVLGTTEGIRFRTENVAEGDHTFSVRVLYKDGEYSEPCSISTTLTDNEAAYVPVSKLAATVNNDLTATLTWKAPLNEDRTDLHWGDLTPRPGLENLGYPVFAIGSIYPVTMTAPYADEYEITHLFYYPTADALFYVTFDDNDETVFYEDYHTPIINQMNYVELPEPITIDASTNYRFLIGVDDCPVGEAPFAYDSSHKNVDGFSNMINAGNEWMTLAEVVQLNEDPNWLMGMVIRQKDARPMPLQGYDVKIDGVKANEANINDCTFTTGTLSEGKHRAIVDVVYDAKRTVSSQPLTINVTADGIESIVADEDMKCYDIQGRRVINDKSGRALFIIGNKKYIYK